MLNGESADVPEDIVADWSVRFPRSAPATGTPEKAMLSVHDTVMHCRVFPSPPPLFYDHTNVILRVVVKERFNCIGLSN